MELALGPARRPRLEIVADTTIRMLTPGEAVEATGLSLDTLRYYERERLIGPIARSVGGTRRYTTDDVAWIGIVTCLRDAGLGIDHLRRFTALLRTESGADDRVAFLTRRREELQAQQRSITAALQVLDDKIAYWTA
jgi:DNA-binding transcriptional MerR regulator